MASKVLTEISKDEAERVAYIEHLIWTTDQESKLFYAEKKGKQQGIKENQIITAKNMLDIGLTIEQIVKVTGLSIEEIKKLQKN